MFIPLFYKEEEEEKENRVHPAQKGIVLYGRRVALYKPVHANATLLRPVPRKSLLASRVNFTSRALSKFSFRAADKFRRGGSQIFPQLREDTRNPFLPWEDARRPIGINFDSFYLAAGKLARDRVDCTREESLGIDGIWNMKGWKMQFLGQLMDAIIIERLERSMHGLRI